MGRHRAATVARGGATRVEGLRRRPWWQRWFKGDWWWLLGFTLGLVTGLLGAYATFLWWLTGGLSDAWDMWF